METIGIPRALGFHYMGELWKEFFERLGFKVLISPETDADMVDKGVKNSDTDLCFAVKIYVGHILKLKDKVDYIFIPDISSKGKYFCSYYLALYDLIKNMFPKLKILTADLKIDSEYNLLEKENEFYKIGKKLGKTKKEIGGVLDSSIKKWKKQIKKEEIEDLKKLKLKKYKIAIIGAEYVVKDKFCLMDIPKYLEEENAVPIFFYYAKHIKDYNLGFEVRWALEQELINKFMEAVKLKGIDGIIYITPFSCGPCFLFYEQVISKHNKKTLILNIDESQNKTRIKTRIEAFMDVINKNNNLKIKQ
ncbi:MAG: acyl-CoA dehydratase activase-related protein [archaeon]